MNFKLYMMPFKTCQFYFQNISALSLSLTRKTWTHHQCKLPSQTSNDHHTIVVEVQITFFTVLSWNCCHVSPINLTSPDNESGQAYTAQAEIFIYALIVCTYNVMHLPMRFCVVSSNR